MIKQMGILVVVAMLAFACGGDDDTADGSGETIDVSLFEWGVTPSAPTVSTGQVTFNAKNDGSEEHEIIIVKDVAPGDFVVVDGKVDEDELPEGAFIGEIEVDAGESGDKTFDLEPGTYTIFCNIVETEDGVLESHFELGMVNTIEVTS